MSKNIKAIQMNWNTTLKGFETAVTRELEKHPDLPFMHNLISLAQDVPSQFQMSVGQLAFIEMLWIKWLDLHMEVDPQEGGNHG